MAILAECDICGNQHRVKDGLVGQSIRCKDCGVMFVVLDGNQITPETFVEEAGRLYRREPVQAPRLWPRFIAAGVTVLVLAILVAIIWTLVRLIQSGFHQGLNVADQLDIRYRQALMRCASEFQQSQGSE